LLLEKSLTENQLRCSSLTRGSLVLRKLAYATGKIHLCWEVEAKKLFHNFVIIVNAVSSEADHERAS